jgi:ribokinase
MSFDVVCIGAATEDNFYFSKDFEVKEPHLLLPWKEKFTVRDFERHLGGGAFNASVAFSRLGLESAFFGRVGDDRTGRAVKEFLDGEGVSTELLVVDPKVTTSTSALLSCRGERVIVMYRGKNDDLLETDPQWDGMLSAKWVFLADLAGSNNDVIFEVAERLKEKGAKLAYVPGQNELSLGTDKLKSVLEKAELLVLNLYEARMILGEDRPVKELLAGFKEIGVGTPVITQDVKGSDAYDGERFYHQDAVVAEEVVDETGAGDAFSSTFTAGIMLGRSVPDALSLAAKNAGSVVTKVGGVGGLLTLDELER